GRSVGLGVGGARGGDEALGSGLLSEEIVGDGSAATLVLLDEVRDELRVDFFGAAFGAGVASVVSVAVDGAGVGAATGGLASATFVSVVVVELVSLEGGVTFDDARFEVAAGTMAAGLDATSWLNRNAPAITRAMITPNAIGKCFT